jgi:putative endonuclease
MNRSEAGHAGEERAAFALEAAGFQIVARNVRSRYGEIDLVARDATVLVFVEVKAWSSYGIENLQYSVDKRKQCRIIETAKDFLARNAEFVGLSIRFDVIFIGTEGIIHLESAFVEEV